MKRFWKIAACVYTFVLTMYVVLIWTWGHPLLTPDQGHYLFGINGANAAAAGVEIDDIHGVWLWKVKKIGPSHQVWMSDHSVYNWIDPDSALKGWPATARSLVSENPGESANRAADILLKYGFKDVQKVEVPGTEKPGTLWLVKSDQAFPGWCLAFRLSGRRMGMPPNDKPLPFLSLLLSAGA